MRVIRRAVPADADAMRRIFAAVVEAGDSYVFEADTSEADFLAYWFGEGVSSFVCEDGGHLLGMYKLISNQRGRGAHVANASFMVDPGARGRGLGRQLGEHCLDEARRAGYRAMQFNFVVSTNRRAVDLWRDLGFAVAGTLPGAFRHESLGYVDAFVMFRAL